MRWGKDKEERSAIVQKAHDTYALVRRLQEQMAGTEAKMADLGARLAEAEAMIGVLQSAVDDRKPRRKAA